MKLPLSVLLFLAPCLGCAEGVPPDLPVHAEVTKALGTQFHYQPPQAAPKASPTATGDTGVVRMQPYTVLSSRLNRSLSEDFEKQQGVIDGRRLIWQNGGTIEKHVSREVTTEFHFTYKNDVGRMGNIELFKLSW
jgi:hypothetical protein